MSERSIALLRSQLAKRETYDVLETEDVIDYITKRDEAWARYAEARADYADETMCGDPRRVTTERNAARDALIAMGVDPELLG